MSIFSKRSRISFSKVSIEGLIPLVLFQEHQLLPVILLFCNVLLTFSSFPPIGIDSFLFLKFMSLVF